MFSLERFPRITEGEMLSRFLGLEIGTALIQETSQTRKQCPESQDGCAVIS